MKLRQIVLAMTLIGSVVSARPCAAQSALTLPEFIGTNADAMAGQPEPAAPTPRHTGIKAMFEGLFEDCQHLPSKENAYWAAGGGAAALAVHPLDEKVSRQVTGNPTADAFFAPGANHRLDGGGLGGLGGDLRHRADPRRAQSVAPRHGPAAGHRRIDHSDANTEVHDAAPAPGWDDP